jgi:hypothetical protein
MHQIPFRDEQACGDAQKQVGAGLKPAPLQRRITGSPSALLSTSYAVPVRQALLDRIASIDRNRRARHKI